MPTIFIDKKVKYEYEFLDRYKAGIVLLGPEVKSIKNGRINLEGSYVVEKNGEMFLINAKIAAYQPKNQHSDYDPERSRKLLLRKSEIQEIIGKISQKGLTLKPISVYTEKGKIKIEFGLARHKKTHDKRATIIKREIQKDIDRELKSRG